MRLPDSPVPEAVVAAEVEVVAAAAEVVAATAWVSASGMDPHYCYPHRHRNMPLAKALKSQPTGQSEKPPEVILNVS